eukprot:XP_002940384.3 PREDICTED: myelin and lymphocyte protein [Xenopus tropicalis]
MLPVSFSHGANFPINIILYTNTAQLLLSWEAAVAELVIINLSYLQGTRHPRTLSNLIMSAVNIAQTYATNSPLPSGLRTFLSFPEALMILELIFGGLVWILVAATRVFLPLLQGWVMFVSVTFFVLTLLLLIMYILGSHKDRCSWILMDAVYHCIAVLFYLSAAVLQANATITTKNSQKIYQENIAATVFAFIATLLYLIHAIFSLMRWKKSA